VESFIPTFFQESGTELGGRVLVATALQNFHLFLMVVIRMSGLMTIGPVFGQALVPANVRILLILTISLIVTPTLFYQAQIGFNKLDSDENQYLSRAEVPEHLQPRFDGILNQYDRAPETGLNFHEYHLGLKVSSTLFDFGWKVMNEFAVGLCLGLGVMIILSGLQMVGEMVDQQIGIALGGVFNPDMGTQTSISGQLMFLLGTTLFVLLTPLNGHVKMVGALIETFQTLPAGEAVIGEASIQLLSQLIHQSMALAIQVSLPLLAATSLVSLAMGFLGHSVPQVNVLMIGFAVRAIVNVFVLLFCLSAGGRTIVKLLPEVIDNIFFTLTGL